MDDTNWSDEFKEFTHLWSVGIINYTYMGLHAVVEKLVGHFLKIGHFCRLLIAVPMNTENLADQKRILVGQMLKLVGK